MDLLSLDARIDNTTYKNLRIGFIWASKISLVVLTLMTVVLCIEFFNQKYQYLIHAMLYFGIQVLLCILGGAFFHYHKTLKYYKFITSSYALIFGVSWGISIINLDSIYHAYVLIEIIGNLLFLIILLGFYTSRIAVYLAILPILIFTTWYNIADPRFDVLFSLMKLTTTIIILESGRRVLFKWFTTRITQEHENSRLMKQLSLLSLTDQLTNINNRRFFDLTIDEQIINAQHHHHPLSIILIDIDYFKLFNDNFGHVKGDICLKSVATTISESLLRETDTVSRYGGEEFVVLLPNTNTKGACCVAQRVQQNLSTLAITHPRSTISQHVTVSQGIATLKINQHPNQLINVADNHLYKAKALGRNQYYFE